MKKDVSVSSSVDVPAVCPPVGIPELHPEDRVIVVLGFNHDEAETEAFIRKTYPNAEIEFHHWDAKIDVRKLVETFQNTEIDWGKVVEILCEVKSEVKKAKAWQKIALCFAGMGVSATVVAAWLIYNWLKARANSDKEVEKLAKRLLEESEELRSRTVLIGHSLGGRIVVKTLAKLAEHGKKINRAIVMGAAIDVKNSEEQIKRAPAGTQNGVENRINADDHILNKLYKMGDFKIDLSTKPKFRGARALGIFGAGDLKIKHWKDIKIVDKKISNHYFNCYWRIGKNEKTTGNFSTDISDRRSRGI